MKNIENTTVWMLCIVTLEKMDLSKVCFDQNSDDCTNEYTKEEIIESVLKMALYTYEKDVITRKMSSEKLLQMESNGEIINSNLFFRMARHYYLLEKITGVDYSLHCTLCSTIHAYLGNVLYFEARQDIIRNIFEYGIQLTMIDKYDFVVTDYNKAIIDAIDLLQGYGFKLNVSYSTIECDEKINDAIFQRLETKIKTVGGLVFLEYLARKYFCDNYVALIDRYMVTRTFEYKQSTPIQLLISLAIKHLSLAKRYNENMNHQCTEIVDLAQAWYNIWDVEGESGIEYAINQYENYPLLLFNQMIVDKFCVPKQYNKDYILASLDYMIKPLFSYCQRKYSYEDYRKVTCYFLDLPYFMCMVNIEQLKQQLDVSNYKIDLILRDMSIGAKDVNSEFGSIEAICNHFKWPLICFPVDKYLYIDYHLCGFGFYHVLYEMIKEEYSLIDKMQGTYVENMLKEELRKKNYTFLCGKYPEIKRLNLNNSECDLVMQDKTTYFFEVKKTAITSELENLDDVSMLKQLSKGMVKAQKQCYQHEAYLKLNGSMLLNDNGDEKEVKPVCEQDCCFKISVCHQEYSFLTSKRFCTLLLEVIALGGFSVVDSERQGDLENLNRLGDTILDTIRCWKGMDQIVLQDDLFYSMFCSLQQILIALWVSKDESDFLEMIKEWFYCQDKSLDVYLQIVTHLYYRENPEKACLKKAAIEMFERTGKRCMYIG